jgi:hypothetical protein
MCGYAGCGLPDDERFERCRRVQLRDSLESLPKHTPARDAGRHLWERVAFADSSEATGTRSNGLGGAATPGEKGEPAATPKGT